MKKIVFGFKRSIKFFVTIFTSREFAFIYCLLGTIIQISHTYFLTNEISSFTGNFKWIQSVMISAFISSSLLYFVAIADKDDKKEYKKIFWAINIFMIMEMLINMYYYTRHLIIDVDTWRMFDFIFAIPISMLIPITIKLYASHIKAKDWIAEFENEESDAEIKTNHIDETIIMESIEQKINEKIELEFNKSSEKLTDDGIITKEFIESVRNDFYKTLDSDVAKVFEKHQHLFLKQFENKAQVLMNNLINQSKSNIEKIESEIPIAEKQS